jgi:hypothetical protein
MSSKSPHASDGPPPESQRVDRKKKTEKRSENVLEIDRLLS